jgi:uncharacterized membrane protein
LLQLVMDKRANSPQCGSGRRRCPCRFRLDRNLFWFFVATLHAWEREDVDMQCKVLMRQTMGRGVVTLRECER